MGGQGSGGRRPGAGRKPKSDAIRALDGNAGHRRRTADVVPHPSAPPAPVLPALDEADVPNDLGHEERLVWLELAPHALASRTLTASTSLGFRMLCRNVVLERQYAQSVTDRGSANHRGLIQRVDAELLRFNLAPCGKPMSQPATEPASDPLKERYFGRR